MKENDILLINKIIDRDLNASETEELKIRLQNDEAFRTEFTDELKWYADIDNAMKEMTKPDLSSIETGNEHLFRVKKNRQGSKIRSISLAKLAVAACVIVLLGFATFFVMVNQQMVLQLIPQQELQLGENDMPEYGSAFYLGSRLEVPSEYKIVELKKNFQNTPLPLPAGNTVTFHEEWGVGIYCITVNSNNQKEDYYYEVVYDYRLMYFAMGIVFLVAIVIIFKIKILSPQ